MKNVYFYACALCVLFIISWFSNSQCLNFIAISTKVLTVDHTYARSSKYDVQLQVADGPVRRRCQSEMPHAEDHYSDLHVMDKVKQLTYGKPRRRPRGVVHVSALRIVSPWGPRQFRLIRDMFSDFKHLDLLHGLRARAGPVHF